MKFFKRIILMAFIFCLITPNSFSIDEKKENSNPLTLKNCIELALKNSPYIKKQKLNYEVSKHDVKIAQSVYFPTIGAGVGYDLSERLRKEKNTTSNALSVQASISQLIWDFGKSNANIKMEKFYKILAYHNFDTTVLDTIFDVKVKYYSVLASKAAIEIDKSNLQINERNYQRIDAYFEEGLKSKIDLVNAEVNVTQAKVSLVGSENTHKNALSDLNNSMYLAYNPEYNIEVPKEYGFIKDLTPKSLTETTTSTEDLLAPPQSVDDAKLTARVETQDYASVYKIEKFPYSFEECLKIANEKRPDIKAYEASLNAMQEYYKMVRRDYYPELSAAGFYSYNGSKANGTPYDNTNNFNVSLNLSTSTNIMRQVNMQNRAKLQIDLAQNDIETLRQNIYFEIQEAYINMKEYEEKIPLLGQKISQTLENLELADGRYGVGLGDYIELQDAKMNYNSAQHAYVQAIFYYNVAKARLEQAIALDSEVNVKLED